MKNIKSPSDITVCMHVADRWMRQHDERNTVIGIAHDVVEDADVYHSDIAMSAIIAIVRAAAIAHNRLADDGDFVLAAI